MNCIFFFQAEDGIRDYKVTGVQTCALPISQRQGSRVDIRVRRRWWSAGGPGRDENAAAEHAGDARQLAGHGRRSREGTEDRKSTRLNSSHLVISYAVFCLKKKKNAIRKTTL